MRRSFTGNKFVLPFLAVVIFFAACEKENFPAADFSYENDGCNAPCRVTFSNTSLGNFSAAYVWSFGDGTVIDTNGADVSHRYTKPGIYQVSLRAVDENGQSEKTAYITIRGGGSSFKPNADFEIIGNGCKAPCRVSFVNRSEGAVSYRWKFEDNTTSTAVTPYDREYDAAGQYTVELTAVNAYGESKAVKTVNIVCATAALTRLALLEFPLFRPNGNLWDFNSCCPDIEMRVLNVDKNQYVITGEYVADAFSPPLFWSGPNAIDIPNGERLRVEFWDYDGPGAYEFIGATGEFRLGDAQNCRAPFLVLNSPNLISVQLELVWN